MSKFNVSQQAMLDEAADLGERMIALVGDAELGVAIMAISVLIVKIKRDIRKDRAFIFSLLTMVLDDIEDNNNPAYTKLMDS